MRIIFSEVQELVNTPTNLIQYNDIELILEVGDFVGDISTNDGFEVSIETNQYYSTMFTCTTNGLFLSIKNPNIIVPKMEYPFKTKWEKYDLNKSIHKFVYDKLIEKYSFEILS